MLEIERAEGGPLVIPFTSAAVPVIDIAAGRIVLAPPEGLLAPAPPDEGEED